MWFFLKYIFGLSRSMFVGQNDLIHVFLIQPNAQSETFYISKFPKSLQPKVILSFLFFDSLILGSENQKGVDFWRIFDSLNLEILHLGGLLDFEGYE